MGAPFDVFSFANDVGKGVGGLVKGAADVAAGAVGIAANLVEGAASELTERTSTPTRRSYWKPAIEMEWFLKSTTSPFPMCACDESSSTTSEEWWKDLRNTFASLIEDSS